MQITADNVQEVTDRINMIVQTNSTEEQSSENLQAVTDVLSNTVNLLGNISVSAEVMMLHNYFELCLFFCTKCVATPQFQQCCGSCVIHHPNVK